ncbi:hypothetical protein O988_09028 [Pseudogymnoascus sp. VKM F-3808]|nr:hypothetical protein O988_09028 [Pseudogymnoascus sp. VKM F-3808]
MQIEAQSSASASVNEDIRGNKTTTNVNIVPLNTIFWKVLGISNAIDEILLEHQNQFANLALIQDREIRLQEENSFLIEY